MSKKKPKKLNPSFVEHIAKPGRYGDGRGGHGLSLLVKPTQELGRWSKTWAQRLQIAGEGIFSWPGLISHSPSGQGQGCCPRQCHPSGSGRRHQEAAIARDSARHSDRSRGVRRSDKAASKKWRSPKTKKIWELSLRYCKGIASMPVSKIRPSDIVDLIEPLWDEKGRTPRMYSATSPASWKGS